MSVPLRLVNSHGVKVEGELDFGSSTNRTLNELHTLDREALTSGHVLQWNGSAVVSSTIDASVHGLLSSSADADLGANALSTSGGIVLVDTENSKSHRYKQYNGQIYSQNIDDGNDKRWYLHCNETPEKGYNLDVRNCPISAVPRIEFFGGGKTLGVDGMSNLTYNSHILMTETNVNDYVTAPDLSGYALASDVSAIDGRVSTLEGATASYALASDVSAIDGRVSTLEGVDTSVYATKTGEETLENKTLASPLVQNMMTLQNNAGTATEIVKLFKESVAYNDNKLVVSFTPASGQTLLLDVRAVFKNKGFIEFKKMFNNTAGALSSVTSADSKVHYGAGGVIDGDELDFVINGSNVEVRLVGNPATINPANVNCESAVFVKAQVFDF